MRCLLTLAERAPGMALRSTRAADAKSWAFMLVTVAYVRCIVLILIQNQKYDSVLYWNNAWSANEANPTKMCTSVGSCRIDTSS